MQVAHVHGKKPHVCSHVRCLRIRYKHIVLFFLPQLYCRHCGNNFCSKCCNQKVPKSMFGATGNSHTHSILQSAFYDVRVVARIKV